VKRPGNGFTRPPDAFAPTRSAWFHSTVSTHATVTAHTNPCHSAPRHDDGLATPPRATALNPPAPIVWFANGPTPRRHGGRRMTLLQLASDAASSSPCSPRSAFATHPATSPRRPPPSTHGSAAGPGLAGLPPAWRGRSTTFSSPDTARRGWRATFSPAGIGHSLTPMVGSAWTRARWSAVQGGDQHPPDSGDPPRRVRGIHLDGLSRRGVTQRGEHAAAGLPRRLVARRRGPDLRPTLARATARS